jgi:hypothetical protein
MGWLAKNLFRLLVLAAIGLAGYALFADLDAPREPRAIAIENPAAGE